jgi:HK97 family phage prohead protease
MKIEAFGKILHGAEIRRATADVKEAAARGYAAVYNTDYETEWMIEVIKPGAFDRALREKHDVRSLVDHDPTLILGRTKSNTLKLSADEKGLLSETIFPNTTYASDMIEKMSRGDVDGMSFGFIPIKESWGVRNGKLLREIEDLELFDTSIVTYPAFQSTSVNLRSRADILQSGQDYILKNQTVPVEQMEEIFLRDMKYLAALCGDGSWLGAYWQLRRARRSNGNPVGLECFPVER